MALKSLAVFYNNHLSKIQISSACKEDNNDDLLLFIEKSGRVRRWGKLLVDDKQKEIYLECAHKNLTLVSQKFGQQL